ncbi:MAG: hypothetical protein U9N61_02445 [Euryarchaeota archaeon]|nr:hypothetical protein [Euryarchaeota archaeon]
MAYERDEAVKSERAGLVMTKYPGDKRDRFHVMSPCKTDLVVVAYEQDDWRCKCEEFYKHDSNEIVYKMQKVKCEADEHYKRPAPINADGSCPKKYSFAGTEYDVKAVASERKKTHEGGETFSCDFSGVPYDDINEALEKCKYEFMHRDGCEDNPNTDYDDCLIDLYRDCYFDPDETFPRYPGTDTEGNYFCDNDQEGLNCDENGCIGMDNSYYTVPFSRHQDTFAIPVNAKENVNTGVLEPISVCTNSWSSDFLEGIGLGRPNAPKPCIAVRYDVDSMRGYLKAGFGVNYCAENRATFEKGLEGTCFWGGMAGAVVISAFSGGGTAAVIIPVAIGSAGTLCEKIMQMKTKWPQDQY